jgi:hypothetical protein
MFEILPIFRTSIRVCLIEIFPLLLIVTNSGKAVPESVGQSLNDTSNNYSAQKRTSILLLIRSHLRLSTDKCDHT